MKNSILGILLLLSIPCLPQQGNTSYGTQAGNSGDYNSSFGYAAGSLVTGSSNTFIGYNAGVNTTIGYSNTFIGFRAGISNTSAINNVFFGPEAGYSNTTSGGNQFMGLRAGYSNTGGIRNFFVGQYSGQE